MSAPDPMPKGYEQTGQPTRWVVTGSVGEYSDRREWVAAVLTGGTIEAARAWCDRCAAQARDLWAWREREHDRDNAGLPTVPAPEGSWHSALVDHLDDATGRTGEDVDRWSTEMDPLCDVDGYDPPQYTLHVVQEVDLDG